MSPFGIQRLLLAASVLLAPVFLMSWFSLCPQYGNPQCPTSADPMAALVAFRVADPTLMSIFLTLGVLIPYIYPLSYLGLGGLVNKRSPWLATSGVALGWFGSIPWGAIGVAEFVYYDLARAGNDAFALVLLNELYMHWQIYYIVAAGWVLGHQAAYIILGVAFWRTRIIPRWSAVLLIVSGPLMGPIAYGSGIGWLQVSGYGLVLLGSVPAAFRLIRGSKELT